MKIVCEEGLILFIFVKTIIIITMGCWPISRLLMHHYMLRQHDFNDGTLAANDDDAGRACSLMLIVVFAVYLWLCALLLLVCIMKLMR